jgi:hypothetical protein
MAAAKGSKSGSFKKGKGPKNIAPKVNALKKGASMGKGGKGGGGGGGGGGG